MSRLVRIASPPHFTIIEITIIIKIIQNKKWTDLVISKLLSKGNTLTYM